MATQHPELRQLLSFTLDRVSEEEGRKVTEHLSGCTLCQQCGWRTAGGRPTGRRW